MLRYLIHRPVAVIMTTLSLVVITLVFLKKIPISLLPEIPVPKIIVKIDVPNADARTLENTVIRPLRNQLLQVSSIKNIKSKANNGSATIDITLGYGTNIDLAQIEINEKIDQAMYLLPRNVKRPKIVKTALSDLPIYEIAVLPRDTNLINKRALSIFCEKEIVRRLEQLEEVAIVDMHGYTQPEISVKPDLNLLQPLNINLDQLVAQIKDKNVELGNVVLKDGAYEYHVLLTSTLRTVDDIKNIPVRLGNQTYLLKQVAEIRIDERPERGSYLYNDQEAIALSVRKQPDANNFKLKEEIDRLLVLFSKDYPNLKIIIMQDQSKILQVAYDNLFSSLSFGLFFSALIMFWFFGNWRTSLIILVVVPVSLCITLLFFYLLKISINLVSLSGLILGVGLMIDNAIIIIENIRIWLKDHTLEDTVVKAPNEILAPMFSSSLTNIAVFAPLVLFGGIAGALFYDQALSITIALTCSVFLSYTLIPVLFFHLMKKRFGHIDVNEKKSSVFNIHHIILRFSIKHKVFTIGTFLTIMIIGVYYIGKLPIQSFPKTTVETLDVQIDWGSQIGVSENEERIMQLYSVLKKDVINCSAHVGEYQYLLSDQDQHVNEFLLKVNIKANKDIEISQIIRDYFEKNHQDVTYIISPSKTIFDYIINTDVYPFSLYISERSRLESPNTSIISKVREALDTYDIKTAAPSTQSYLALKIDWEKAGIYHVNPEQIIQTLQSLFGNYYVTDLRSSEQYVPVYLSSKDKQVNKEIINSTTITNGLNQTLPLSEFISWSIEDNYKTITADRVGEMVELGIGQYDQRLTEITDNLRRQFNTLEIRTGGQHLENVKMIAELKFIFMIAICLLYLILASQFESLVLPFIVLISVPVSAAGGLTVLYFAGHSVNILSMTGLIIMSGIVINDSILKVDMLKMGIKNGLSLQEATVAAGEKRFSAIIMTSMTTILEFVPMFFSSGLGVEIQVPMGIVLISGIIIGTFLSLSLIPVLFSYYYYFTK